MKRFIVYIDDYLVVGARETLAEAKDLADSHARRLIDGHAAYVFVLGPKVYTSPGVSESEERAMEGNR
jgi:hypothetical protein